jgi:hypothetical protein
VAASMLRKEPDERPSVPQLLELPLVRRHLRLYAQFVKQSVVRRRESFKRSLVNYCDPDEARLYMRDDGSCGSPAIHGSQCKFAAIVASS